jgi:hypothetical protein
MILKFYLLTSRVNVRVGLLVLLIAMTNLVYVMPKLTLVDHTSLRISASCTICQTSGMCFPHASDAQDKHGVRWTCQIGCHVFVVGREKTGNKSKTLCMSGEALFENGTVGTMKVKHKKFTFSFVLLFIWILKWENNLMDDINFLYCTWPSYRDSWVKFNYEWW